MKQIEDVIIAKVESLCELYKEEYEQLVASHHFFYNTDSQDESKKIINKKLISQPLATTEQQFRDKQWEDMVSWNS